MDTCKEKFLFFARRFSRGFFFTPKLSKLPKLSRARAFKQLFDEGFNLFAFGRRNV